MTDTDTPNDPGAGAGPTGSNTPPVVELDPYRVRAMLHHLAVTLEREPHISDDSADHLIGIHEWLSHALDEAEEDRR